MLHEVYKIREICLRTWILRRDVQTDSLFLMRANLGVSQRKETAASKDVVNVDAGILLQRFKRMWIHILQLVWAIAIFVRLQVMCLFRNISQLAKDNV